MPNASSVTPTGEERGERGEERWLNKYDCLYKHHSNEQYQLEK